jgi:hypothetical protein
MGDNFLEYILKAPKRVVVISNRTTSLSIGASVPLNEPGGGGGGGCACE